MSLGSLCMVTLIAACGEKGTSHTASTPVIRGAMQLDAMTKSMLRPSPAADRHVPAKGPTMTASTQ